MHLYFDVFSLTSLPAVRSQLPGLPGILCLTHLRLPSFPLCVRSCQDCEDSMGYDLCGACQDSSCPKSGRFGQNHTPHHVMRQEPPELQVDVRNVTSPGRQIGFMNILQVCALYFKKACRRECSPTGLAVRLKLGFSYCILY